MMRDMKDPTYRSWQGMKQRCLNPRNPRYYQYGGAGILIQDSWRQFSRFLADMGERPIGTSIERKDNKGNYCKDNCIWLPTHLQQRNTRRNVLTNELVQYIKKQKELSPRGRSDRRLALILAKELSIGHETVREVLKGRCWK